MAEGAELAGDGGVPVERVAGRIDLHADSVFACADGESHGEGFALVVRRMLISSVRMGCSAMDVVVVAEVAIHPDVDLAAGKRILPDDLQ